MLAACAPPGPPTNDWSLVVYRASPPAFVELNDDLVVQDEVPFSAPTDCAVQAAYPAPRGPTLAVELGCPFGQAVVLLNLDTQAAMQPITTSDSHFLAWSKEGDALYLRIDSINRPRIVRSSLGGDLHELKLSELSYDLAPAPHDDEFVFSLSRGMGHGSEMWRGRDSGEGLRMVASDPAAYLAFARWSPDGREIAYLKIPDTAVPFSVGELWVMDANGSNGRRLAEADAGHGFAPAWSPDGTQIAFVVRENRDDPEADVTSAALVSNIHLADTRNGKVASIRKFQSARVEAPQWKPDGSALAFIARVDDRMTAYVVQTESGDVMAVPVQGTCCVGWVRR